MLDLLCHCDSPPRPPLQSPSGHYSSLYLCSLLADQEIKMAFCHGWMGGFLHATTYECHKESALRPIASATCLCCAVLKFSASQGTQLPTPRYNYDTGNRPVLEQKRPQHIKQCLMEK